MCETNKTVHLFEAAGLGKAPFRYIGMEPQEIQYGNRVIGNAGGVDITTKPGGTCAYCGTYIVNMFNVISSDGKEFHVGCECIKKVDATMHKKAQEELRKHKKNEKRRQVEDRCRRVLDEVTAKTPNNCFALPHRNKHLAERGEMLKDWVVWMIANAGLTGMSYACEIWEKNKIK